MSSNKSQFQVRKLGRIGGKKHYSYYVTLPKAMVKQLGWHDGQPLVIKRVGTKLSIRQN